MRPLKYIPSYTVKDYQLWEGDWELIDGLPYAMSPSPVRRHQQLGAQLCLQIGNSLKNSQSSCGDCSVVYELDWIIDNTTVVRPDIAVICNQNDDFITAAPLLIIEILSPSTAFKDRQVKFEIYQEQGVNFYLLVDPDANAYSVYQLINGVYVQQETKSTFLIHSNCHIELNVEEALGDIKK